jgi:tetratricopeptide (TPR) repeat protein
MQQELRTYTKDRTAKALPTLEARVGVHTGEVVAYAGEAGGKVEYRLIGHTANLAARMESIATVGSIAISEATAKLCDGYFELRELGPTTVKGVSTPVNVYEVLGLGPLRTHFELSTRRGLTRFVGRERELEQMRRALEQSLAGHGQIVAVVAEAGTGKSRLFYEFKATIPAECKVLGAYSVSHGKISAWLPVLELLHGYFGVTEADDAAWRRNKVRAALAALDPALEDTLPYLFGLLGVVDAPDPYAQMDAWIKRQRTLDAIKRIILRDSLRQPVVVIFEDLHWIDEQTQVLLDLLADSAASARMLLLFNYRPEYHHGWGNKSYYSQLRLDPLAGADGAAMLTALLGEGDELSPLKRLIAERTGGNPFFIEEIVQGLFEDGALVRNGAVRITRSLSQLRLPPSVQGMLAARVDRLPRPQKDLLQTLAVIGREARLRLVREVTSAEEVLLSQNLADLCAAEFIYEQPVIGDTEFVFKHALTQEVAYSSLLIERRKELHERVGYWTEKLFADKLDDHLDALAHHYSHSDNAAKAIEYLKRAAQQAADRSAVSEAERQLHDAVSLLVLGPTTPDRDSRELELQTALCTLLVSRSFAAHEREDPLQRAYKLCERLGDQRETLPVRFQLGQFYIMRARFSEARQLTERALTLANSAEDRILAAGVHENLAECNFWTGDLRGAPVHFARALADCANASPPALIRLYGFDLWLMSAGFLSIVQLLMGQPDRAIELERRIIERARSSSHPYSHAIGLQMAAVTRWVRRDMSATSEIAIEALQMCDEYGFHEMGGLIKQFDGWAQFWRGERALGIAEMNEAIQDLKAVGSSTASSSRFALLAEMQLENGEIGAAEDELKKAFESLKSTQEGWHEPEVYRIAAQVMFQSPDRDPLAAEECLHRAIRIAKAQGAKWWELRSSVSLAHLLRDTNRHDEARTMLAEIYNWFTEGFDTADLRNAKALLAELSL